MVLDLHVHLLYPHRANSVDPQVWSPRYSAAPDLPLIMLSQAVRHDGKKRPRRDWIWVYYRDSTWAWDTVDSVCGGEGR